MRNWMLAAIVSGCLMAQAAPTYADRCAASDISYGAQCDSELGENSAQARDRSRMEMWSFQGSASDCVEIAMASDQFTPYVQLIRGTPGGAVISQGERSIRASLPAAGTYFIKATSAGAGDRTGSYSIALNKC